MRGDGAMGRLIFAPGVENGFCKLVGVFMRHRSITPMPFVSFIIEVGYDALYECCTAIGFEEGFWIVELSDRHTEVVRIEIYHLVCRLLLEKKKDCHNDEELSSRTSSTNVRTNDNQSQIVTRNIA